MGDPLPLRSSADALGADIAAEIRARSAPMLGFVLRASAVVLAAVFVAALLTHGSHPLWPVYGAFATFLLIGLGMEVTGRAEMAGIVVTLGFWATASATVFLMGGVRSPGTLVMVPIVATAALFWDWRAAGALTLASIGIELLALWLESVHMMPPPLRTPTTATLWRVFAGSVAMTGVLVGLAQRGVRAAIADVREMVHRRSIMEAELAELLKRVEQGQRLDALGRLAGGAAHDFNNLIGVILVASSILARETKWTGSSRDCLKAIEESALRAKNLLRHILIASHAPALAPKPLDVGGVVAGLEPIIRRAVGDGVEFVVRKNDAECVVRADPSRLEQAILNLVVNARDAMPEGGQLVVETARGRFADDPLHPLHDAVLLSVTDSGVGMDAETKRRVFEPFFTTKGTEGTGLGLSTVLDVVNESGGEVRVTSELGRGTRFDVFLPRLSA
ncbi:MAG: sensor histidine kinase [Polyangiaceae bacterium]